MANPEVTRFEATSGWTVIRSEPGVIPGVERQQRVKIISSWPLRQAKDPNYLAGYICSMALNKVLASAPDEAAESAEASDAHPARNCNIDPTVRQQHAKTH